MAALQVIDPCINDRIDNHRASKRVWADRRMRSASADVGDVSEVAAASESRYTTSFSSAAGLTPASSREPSKDSTASTRRSSSLVRLGDSPAARNPIKVKRSMTPSASVSPSPVNPSPVFLLPPRKSGVKLTVVFDLDETLVSNRHTPALIARPYCHAVLHGMSQKEDVEVVLWTASTKDVALKVVAELQEMGSTCCFHHIIGRDKQWFSEPTHTKDLRLLGRPMDRVLIVENSVNCCKLNPHNAILVDDFHGKQDDDAALVNVYYMIEAVLQLIYDGYSVGTSLRTLAKEKLLCNWLHLELPDVWKRACLLNIERHKLPPFGKFIKSKSTYDVA